jgi:hypothetical protein
MSKEQWKKKTRWCLWHGFLANFHAKAQWRGTHGGEEEIFVQKRGMN